MIFQAEDLVTIGLLVILEGLLSADNALVLAVMILGLRRADQKKALKYGLVGAFAFRIMATLLATYLIKVGWVKLLGGLYLVYLTYNHFFASGSADERSKPKPAKPWMGLSPLWGTVVKVELVNIAFLGRFHPGCRGGVAQDVGRPDRRPPRHRRHAAGDR
jgi:YkoY family integral membrane protein